MKMTTPNKLTTLRILMVPLICIVPYIKVLSQIMIFDKIEFSLANLIVLVIFVLASLTDMLDGYLARKNNQITDFGKLMDPLADKILVVATMIVLLSWQRMYDFVIVIVLLREFLISGFRCLAAANGNVIAASIYGKSKTVSQIIMIIYLLVFKPSFTSFSGIIGMILICVSTLLTIISGVDYIVKNKGVIKSI